MEWRADSARGMDPGKHGNLSRRKPRGRPLWLFVEDHPGRGRVGARFLPHWARRSTSGGLASSKARTRSPR